MLNITTVAGKCDACDYANTGGDLTKKQVYRISAGGSKHLSDLCEDCFRSVIELYQQGGETIEYRS